MSTRANIILKEGNEELFFYRHSDGYPDGVMPTLNRLSEWIKTKKIRNNLTQGAGWLIVLGAMEAGTIPKYKQKDYTLIACEEPTDWKCGEYEPTTGIHGDVEYIYTVDMNTGEIETKEA